MVRFACLAERSRAFLKCGFLLQSIGTRERSVRSMLWARASQGEVDLRRGGAEPGRHSHRENLDVSSCIPCLAFARPARTESKSNFYYFFKKMKIGL